MSQKNAKWPSFQKGENKISLLSTEETAKRHNVRPFYVYPCGNHEKSDSTKLGKDWNNRISHVLRESVSSITQRGTRQPLLNLQPCRCYNPALTSLKSWFIETQPHAHQLCRRTTTAALAVKGEREKTLKLPLRRIDTMVESYHGILNNS